MDYSIAEELKRTLGEIKSGVDGSKNEITQLYGTTDALRRDFSNIKRAQLARGGASAGPRRSGCVSDECAGSLASAVVLHLARHGKLETLCLDAGSRERVYTEAKSLSGIASRAALTTSEIPLPVNYGSELRELISEFGVVRAKMFPYPMGGGTSKPPRMGTWPAFQSIAMSAALPQLLPTLTFASLEPHKLGGVVIMPREIEDQSVVEMGHFLARYAAIEFARAEDTWAFLADGSATYENISGVVKIATDNGKYIQLGATKTAPSDVTLDDLRLLRTKVNKAALNAKRSAYYLDSTFEVFLPTFNTVANPYIYQRLPDGSALLDGYPVVWTDVMTAYGVTANANKPVACFGALDFWWFGQRGMPRIDQSADVLFLYDQIAVRFIEEIDFDYNSIDAMAVLLTAAA